MRQLEEKLRRGAAPLGGGAVAASPHGGAVDSPWASTPGDHPRSAPGSRASSVTATPPSSGPNSQKGIRGRVLSTASSIDRKVDRAFDRVDGIVGRLASARGAKAGTFAPLSTEYD